jgi:hypothetical protein
VRTLLVIVASVFSLSSVAQTAVPLGSISFSTFIPFRSYRPPVDSMATQPSWYFTHSANISAGMIFSNGGTASFIAAPFGIQLNHPLNNNLVAFAGIYAAPGFYSFRNTYGGPFQYPSYPGLYGSNPYSLGINTGIQMGLMYMNDAKTFSISGSFGIERSNYPLYHAPPVPQQVRKKY